MNKKQLISILKMLEVLIRKNGKYSKFRICLTTVITLLSGGSLVINSTPMEGCVTDRDGCISFKDGEWTEELTFTEKIDSLKTLTKGIFE